MAEKIEKIYVIRAEGSGAVIKDLRTINQLYKDLKKSKAEFEAQRRGTQDPAELARINQELLKIAQAETELASLNQSRLASARQEIQANTQLIGTYEQLATGGVASVDAITGAELQMADATAASTAAISQQATAVQTVSAAIAAGRLVEEQATATTLSHAEAQAALTASQELAKQEAAAAQAVTLENAAAMEGATVAIVQAEEAYVAASAQVALLKNSLAENASQISLVNAQYEAGTITTAEYTSQVGGLIETERLLQAELKDANAELALQTREERVNVGSINEARLAVNRLTAERNALNLTTKEGQAQLIQINALIDQQNAFIKKSVDLYTKQKINIGNYPTLTAELRAVRDEMNALLIAGEKDSVMFKQLEQRAQSLSIAMAETAAATKAAEVSQNNFAAAGKKAFSALRLAANILPGIGLAGIFGLIIEGFMSLIHNIEGVETATKQATKALEKYNAELKSIDDSARGAAAAEIAHLKAVNAVATDTTLTLRQRKDAAAEMQKLYPERFAALKEEAILEGAASAAIEASAKAIIARAQAAANEKKLAAAVEKQGSQEDALVKARKDLESYMQFLEKNVLELARLRKDVGRPLDIQEILTGLEEQPDRVFQNELEKRIKAYRSIRVSMDETAKQIEGFATAITDSLKKAGGTGAVFPEGSLGAIRQRVADLNQQLELLVQGTEEFKRVEAERNKLQAQLNEGKFKAGPTDNQIKGAADKLAKDRVAAEKAVVAANAQLRSAQVQQDIEANREIFENDQETLDARLLAYENYLSDRQLQNEIAAKEDVDLNQKVIDGIDEQLANGKVTRSAQEIANLKALREAAVINIQAAREQLAAANAKLAADGLKGIRAILSSEVQQELDQIPAIKDAETQKGNARLEALTASYQKGEITIKQFKKREKQIAQETSLAELEAVKLFLETQIQAYEAIGQSADQFKKSLDTIEQAISKIKGAISANVDQDAFNWKTFWEQMEAEAISAADTIAKGWVAARQKQIDKENELAQTSLDSEKQLRLNAATTADEKLAIEAEFNQKQEQLQRQEFEKNKKLAEAQLALEFAVASMRAISAAFYKGQGWIGAAAAEALVALEYAAKLAVLESSHFAAGGEVPGDGGEFGGQSHKGGGTDFYFKGRQFNAEAKEIAILNKKTSQSGARYQVAGTAKQIASALNAAGGGVNFAPGAKMGRFEYGGSLGSALPTPYFTPSGGLDQQALNSFVSTVGEGFAAMNNRVDKLQVVVDPKAVLNANDRQSKYAKMGQL